jgi:ribose transport system substrate-binding protein
LAELIIVARAYDIAHGWKPDVCERMMFMGATMISSANVDSYSKFVGGDKLPFDWQKMSRVKHPDDWDPQNHVWPMDAAKLWSGTEKPAGYDLPKAYTDAVAGGCIDKLKAEYEDHYKARIPE